MWYLCEYGFTFGATATITAYTNSCHFWKSLNDHTQWDTSPAGVVPRWATPMGWSERSEHHATDAQTGCKR